MTPDQIAKLPYRPCVGIMLLNSDGHVFTAQRLDSTANAWQMPQGGIDAGEDPRTAAFRELEEETGIPHDKVEIIGESKGWVPYDLPHELVPTLWKGRYKGQEQKWFAMRFLGADAEINIETDVPEFSEWRWTPASQVVANIVPFKRDVYAAVLQEFAPLLP
ncbi:MAG: RNA pyrophosphohydrolase [Pseudomonadota bacterium]